MTVELSAAQHRVVAHEGGMVRVTGGAGTGKTTALVHRYLRLATESGAQRILVLARHRAAALRFGQAVLPHLSGGFESISITTAWGLALDLLRRHGRPVRLLTAAQQWALVQELLSAEAGDRRRWPTLHPLVGRRAFADEVAAALLHAQASGYGPDQVRAAGEGRPGGERWVELAGFMDRYLHILDTRGLGDGAGVLAAARTLLDDAHVAAVEHARHPHLLVDDHEAAPPVARHLVRLLRAPSGDVAVAANPAGPAVGATPGATDALFEDLGTGTAPTADIVLDRPFRQAERPVLARCRHPSTEAEAVAGELLAAHHRGVAWADMAVLVRSVGRRDRDIARALARHQIPVQPPGGPVWDEPSVRALVDLLRWVDGDGTALERLVASPLAGLDPAEVRRARRQAKATATPLEDHPALARLVSIRDALVARAAEDDVATLAHRAFGLGLAHLVHEPGNPRSAVEERALDAVVGFLEGVRRHEEDHPGTKLGAYLALLDAPSGGLDPWIRPRPGPGTVTLSSISAAAGQEWHTVVVAGCVDGELPRVGDGLRFFDRAVLGEPSLPSLEQRRLASLEQERRLFALACSRATRAVVAVAAPEPGVLLSRFVEGWDERGPLLSLEGEGHPPPSLPRTAGPVPLWPEAPLTLSASQLATYEDCPLKHAYRYAIGIRGQRGVHANLGTLVHEVLHRFCDPRGPVPVAERSAERLHQVAEECWRDDLAPYRPQLEEARRDLFDMLDLWWEREGSVDGGPPVLATEHRFEADVGPHRLTGRIDRVDRSDDGTGLRVVDYKTGKSKPKPADVADDIQLATYHLGATGDAELSAWGPVRQLRLLHLRTMTAFEQEVPVDGAGATEGRVLATASRMAAEEIGPSVDADCDHCEFHRLCPLWPEGREVGQG